MQHTGTQCWGQFWKLCSSILQTLKCDYNAFQTSYMCKSINLDETKLISVALKPCLWIQSKAAWGCNAKDCWHLQKEYSIKALPHKTVTWCCWHFMMATPGQKISSVIFILRDTYFHGNQPNFPLQAVYFISQAVCNKDWQLRPPNSR
jgi:hypothetical protein